MIGNIVLTIVALVSVGLTRLLFNAIVIRSFGPEVLGNINLAISTACLFSLVASAGLGPAATKYIAEYLGKGEKENSRCSFTIGLFLTVGLSVIMSLVMFRFSKQLATAMNAEPSWFVKTSLIVMLYSLYLFYKNTYYGINKVKTYLKSEIFADVVFFLALFILVIYKLTAFLVVPFILLYTIFLLCAVYTQRSWISFSFMNDLRFKKISMEMLSFSAICMLGTSASMGGRLFSTMLTGSYATLAETGYYSAVLSVSMPFYLLPRSIGLVLFPSIALYYGRKDLKSIERVLSQSTKWLLVTASLPCGIAVIFSELIFRVVTGADYAPGILALRILLVHVYVGIIGVPAINTLLGTKYAYIPNTASVLGLIVAIACWKVLIPTLGIVGTAIGILAMIVTIVCICVYFAQKLFGSDVLASIRIALVAAVMAVASILLGKALFSSPLYSRIVACVIFTVGFTSTYRTDLCDIGKRVWEKIKTSRAL